MKAAALSPVVEVVTIGDELLLGETVDGNAAWLGRRLAADGIRVARRATVGDDAVAIRTAVSEALARTGTVICTGGLGPTPDDLTKAVVAELFGRSLVLDTEMLARLEARFRERGLEMSPSNRSQAEVPERAVVLPNRLGTAPGLALEDASGRIAILLPGVPREMRALVEEQVLPYLAARWPTRPRPVRWRTLRTTGVAESTLADRIADLVPALAPLSLAFLPSTAGVDLRIASFGALPEEEADQALDAAETALRERIGRSIYARDGEDLVAVVGRALTERGLRLAIAESCTGGLIAKRLTDRAGASEYLIAGLVTYADAAKERFLGVGPATLAEHGAVSEETVREMVAGVCQATGADAGIAVTGIAGPGGGTAEKPVGTVWVAASLGEVVQVRRFRFWGEREEIRERSAQGALGMLWRLLMDSESGA